MPIVNTDKYTLRTLAAFARATEIRIGVLSDTKREWAMVS